MSNNQNDPLEGLRPSAGVRDLTVTNVHSTLLAIFEAIIDDLEDEWGEPFHRAS